MEEDTEKAFNEKQGCNMRGKIYINKVPGNFHISSHHYPDALFNLIQKGIQFDYTHTIRELTFGEKDQASEIRNKFGVKFKHELKGAGLK